MFRWTFINLLQQCLRIFIRKIWNSYPLSTPRDISTRVLSSYLRLCVVNHCLGTRWTVRCSVWPWVRPNRINPFCHSVTSFHFVSSHTISAINKFWARTMVILHKNLQYAFWKLPTKTLVCSGLFATTVDAVWVQLSMFQESPIYLNYFLSQWAHTWIIKYRTKVAMINQISD